MNAITCVTSLTEDSAVGGGVGISSHNIHGAWDSADLLVIPSSGGGGGGGRQCGGYMLFYSATRVYT